RESEQAPGEREQDVDETHHESSDTPSVVAREQADRRAEPDRDRDRDQTDRQREPRAVERAAGDVAAKLVTPEQKARSRRLERLARRRLDRVSRTEPRRRQRHRRENRENDHADHGAALPREAP